MLVNTNIVKRRITKRLSRKERRRSILDAALGVLSKEGYSGMTTSRVARATGIAEPILYRHFSSKQNILRALLDEVTMRMIGAFRELVAGDTDPVTALHRICDAYPELARRYSREFRIINQAIFEGKDPKTRRLLEDHYNAYHQFIEALIKRGQQTGGLRRDIPAAVGAWHMIHSALGLLMLQEVRREEFSPRGLALLSNATLFGLLNQNEAFNRSHF